MKANVLLILIVPFIFIGCAYKTEIKPQSMSSISVVKYPYNIAIDGSRLKDKYVNQNFDMGDVTVVYGNAFLEDFKNQIEPNFKSVKLVYPPYTSKDYDVILDVDEDMFFSCAGMGCNYETLTRVKAKDGQNQDLFIKEIPNHFRHTTPGSALGLAFITWFTLFVSSPITMPAIAKVKGDQLSNDITRANRNSIRNLSASILEQNTFVSEKSLNTRMSSGSGFFISNDGYILTNHHVIKDSKNVSIMINQKKVPVTVVDVDTVNDIALLKADITAKGIAIENQAEAKKGSEIVVLGYPNVNIQGNSVKATFGNINDNRGITGDVRHYQISAAIQHGNSGSPLVDSKGNVVGIVVSTLNQSAMLKATGSLTQNVNYAIKVAYAMPMLMNHNVNLVTTKGTNDLSKVDLVSANEKSVVLVTAE